MHEYDKLNSTMTIAYKKKKYKLKIPCRLVNKKRTYVIVDISAVSYTRKFHISAVFTLGDIRESKAFYFDAMLYAPGL